MQRVVLEQRLVVEVKQVDVDVVGGWVLPSNGGKERLHELGLAGATYPRDHLDVPGALERPKPLQVRIAVYPSHNQLLIGFETRIILKFRNREGNVHKDASRSESQSRHVGSDEERVLACYNAAIRDENTVPVG